MNFNTFILTLHDFFSIWVIQIDENSLKGGDHDLTHSLLLTLGGLLVAWWML